MDLEQEDSQPVTSRTLKDKNEEANKSELDGLLKTLIVAINVKNYFSKDHTSATLGSELKTKVK